MSNALQYDKNLSGLLQDAERKLKDTEQKIRVIAVSSTNRSRKLAYYRFLQALRSPKHEHNLWPLGVVIITVVVFAAVSFVLLWSISRSPFLIVALDTLAGITGASLATYLLRCPNDLVLKDRIKVERSILDAESKELAQLNKTLAVVQNNAITIREKRTQIRASGKLERERLLQRNWKAMRDTEWELFLAEVFLALGAHVETTATVGDQGVDLIVQMGNRRTAVQAKGYHNSVSNAAVQQAVAGVSHYNCNSSAVITNSRFTKSAKELAASNNCLLIGENELPNLVRGNISIW